MSSLSWIIGPDYPTNKEFQDLWTCLVDQRESPNQTVTIALNNPGNGDMVIFIDHCRAQNGHIYDALI